MSGDNHRSGPPEKCPTCRKVFAVVKELRLRHPDVRPTAKQIGEMCGVTRVTVQRHLTHLRAHGVLDGLNPVPGATVTVTGPPTDDPSPLEWVASLALRCTGCERVMYVIARRGWCCRMGVEEMATKAGMGVSTCYRHRSHLRKHDLVEFKRDSRPGSAGHRVSIDGTCRIMVGSRTVPPQPGDAGWDVEGWGIAAKNLVDALHWFGASPAVTHQAYEKVYERLQLGWPYEELLRRLAITPDDIVENPVGLLLTLLPDAGERHLAPAGPAGQPRCRLCSVRQREFALTADGVCKECHNDRILTNPGEVVPMAPPGKTPPTRSEFAKALQKRIEANHLRVSA